jgi:hypothetical protein
MFYTMRRGLSKGYDGCEGSGYDYRAMDKYCDSKRLKISSIK